MRPEIKVLCDELMPSADDAVIIDFEAVYSDEVSAGTLGTTNYSRHPDFDAYLVTIYGRGVDFVGHPKDFDWFSINGRPWLAHNASFEEPVFEQLVAIGVIPRGVRPSVWHCTADLSSWINVPRKLDGAARVLFKINLDKSVRDVTMKGKTWAQFTEAERKAVTDYAADDAVAWAIWQKYSSTWPEIERELSRHTRLAQRRGVHIDQDRLDRDIQTLTRARWEVEQQIPWINEEDANGKPFALTSPKAIAAACIEAGVPVPSTTSQKEQAWLDWLDEYGDRVPSVQMVARYRKINRLLEVYRSLRARIRADGRADVGLKYYGADKTGRWAGGSGLNIQNLPKEPLRFDEGFQLSDSATTYVCDIRKVFVAAPGKKFVVADLSQIEPRILNWIIGNEDFLDQLRKGIGPYEAHARASMGWTGGVLKKENPSLYALAKARVLALGYQAGWKKFIEMAPTYISAEDFKAIFEAAVTPEMEERFIEFLRYLSENGLGGAKKDLAEFRTLPREKQNVWVNAYTQVADFRESNPLIRKLWNELNEAFQASVRDGLFELELPSGRSLRYYDVSSYDGWTARRVQGYAPSRVYGGLLTENMIQATARDLFGEAILRLEAHGFNVLWHVHDEVIVEVDESVPAAAVVAVLTQVPEWADGLPVAAEAVESRHYLK